MTKIIFIIVTLFITVACNDGTTTNNQTNNVNNTCGNDTVESGEVCDGSDFNGQTCQTKGFTGGTLVCANTCLRLITSGCTGSNPVCGDNLVDPGEECDGADFEGRSCPADTTGQLSCTSDCYVDESGCRPDPLKVYTSGSRMRMRVGVTTDGARDFRGWYDNDLGINCVFRKMSDGYTRCLPELTAGTVRVYSDPTCTVRLAAFPVEDAVYANETRVSMEVSSGIWKVYSIISARTTISYQNSYGICQELSVAMASAMNDLYSVYPVNDGEFSVQDLQEVLE